MVVIRAPRLKLCGLLVLSLVMVAGSAWLAFGVPGRFLLPGIVGWIGVLFFGFCGGWTLSRLFSNRKSVVLDPEGLIDNSSGIPAGRIGWDQISRVEIVSVSNNRFVGIDVVDREALASSSSSVQRSLERMNIGITGFPIHIPSFAVDRPLEELRDLILRYWQNPKERKSLG